MYLYIWTHYIWKRLLGRRTDEEREADKERKDGAGDGLWDRAIPQTLMTPALTSVRVGTAEEEEEEEAPGLFIHN